MSKTIKNFYSYSYPTPSHNHVWHGLGKITRKNEAHLAFYRFLYFLLRTTAASASPTRLSTIKENINLQPCFKRISLCCCFFRQGSTVEYQTCDIFFLEVGGAVELNPRQRCSVESAASHHANMVTIIASSSNNSSNMI